MDRCGVSRPPATAWLNALAEHGMLQTLKVGRDRLFINRDFLQLLVLQESLAERGLQGLGGSAPERRGRF
jgi:hypothetical protein